MVPGLPYRRDIDGLRAIAVIAVVLYHAAVPGFSGGFVGVDIFFVISGYLITGLILKDDDRGQFSLANFYHRRIRRILPALVVVVGATWIAAAGLLLPQPFKDFSQSLVALALFSTNLLFYSENGYFDAAGQVKPLLHTWSLAVEEQFYILFPLALLLLRRWVPRHWPWCIAAVALLSLGASEWAVRTAPDAAFYLPQYRVWELALGALLAAHRRSWLVAEPLRAAATGVGLVMIACAVYAFSERTRFPGLHALVPCVGAALVIGAGEGGHTRMHRVLRLTPVVFVGLISYSLYLWHWPLLVFAWYTKIDALSAGETAALLTLAMVLATATWRYIEQPFRRTRQPGSSLQRPSMTLATTASLLTVFAIGCFGQVTGGWQSRHRGYAKPDIRGVEDYNWVDCVLLGDQPSSAWRGDACVLDRGGSHTVLLWGDSFAAHYVPGLKHTDWMGAAFVQYNQSGCPPVIGVSIPDRPYCAEFNDHAWSIIRQYGVDTVILAARWEYYWERQVTRIALQRTIDAIRERGLNVVLIGQSPEFPVSHPYDYTYLRGTDLVESHDYRRLNASLANLRGVTAFFEPWPTVCQGLRCHLREGDSFYFLDFGHLSTFGSEQMIQRFMPVLERALHTRATRPGTSFAKTASRDVG